MKEDKRKKRDKGMGRRKVETTPFYRVSLTALKKTPATQPKHQVRCEPALIREMDAPGWRATADVYRHIIHSNNPTLINKHKMIKSSNYKEIKQSANKSSLRSLTHTYTELKDSNNRLRVRRADHLNMFQRSSYQKKTIKHVLP